MATKPQTPKIELERTYIVPLRKEWLKVPEYKRATKAVKALKQFIARHMKVYDRDLKKIKIDINLNNEIRFRGMKKPPAKIEVKAKKFDDGIIRVELAKLPDPLKFKKTKQEKKSEKIKKKVKERKQERMIIEEKTKETDKEEKQAISREDASESSGFDNKNRDNNVRTGVKKPLSVLDEESEKLADKQAKQEKHVSKEKKVTDQDRLAK